jgi:dCTP deaminase
MPGSVRRVPENGILTRTSMRGHGGKMNCETKTGTLNDEDIKSLCQEGLLIEENFDSKRIKQACYELRCGNVYYDLSKGSQKYVLTGKDNLLLKPKQTLVVITMESLRLPAYILGRILTKGVLFSIGILPVNTYADPGFSGRLGIVLHNLSNSYLKIAPGDAIAKIEFSRLQSPVAKPYEGQHGYQTEIWPIRTDMIMTKDEIRQDPRIGQPHEELERAYGIDLALVIRRVFGYERKLLLFGGIYFFIMIVLIGIMSGTQWINTTWAVVLGVGANIIASLIIWGATNIRRS